MSVLASDGLGSWRNRLAVPIANWVLRHIATPEYRLRIEVFLRYGMREVYETEPHPFGYLSTGCRHDQHDQCRMSCKFCTAECRCQCHREAPT